MRIVAKYTLLFLLTVSLMITALLCVSLIPREVIQKKSEDSAAIMMQKDLHFYNLFGNTSAWTELQFGDFSKIDQIADIILLSIAYSIDQNHPLESVLWAGYYDGSKDSDSSIKSMNESFARTVKDQKTVNMQYLRYWHGSLILVRPMLIIWDIRQIKIILGFVLASLFITLILNLYRQGFQSEAISLLIAMSVVNIWFVPLSLEYIWMFLLALSVSHIAVRMVLTNKRQILYPMFFLTGMFAAYFDFFTTETLTLLIPLLLTIRMIRKENKYDSDLNRSLWMHAGKSLILWSIGYVASWSAKWGVSAIFLRTNVIPYIQHVREHLGLTDEISAFRQAYEAIFRNISPLFPFGYGMIGAITFTALAIFFVIIPVCMNKICLKRRIDWNMVLLYFLLGSIVYIRFIILRHHSWYHYFFTCRAQAATVLASCFIVMELIDRQVKKERMIGR